MAPLHGIRRQQVQSKGRPALATEGKHDGSRKRESGRLGSGNELLAALGRAVDLDPGNGAYLDSLGWVYYRLGDLDRPQ